MKTVLVAGEINVDLVFGDCSAMPQPDTEALAGTFRQVPGSSSMICAMGLARLGRPVRFAGCAGKDAYGDFCIAALRDAGIDVAAIDQRSGAATGVTAVLSTRLDRALVTYPGSIAALHATDISDAMLAGAQHLHVSSYYLQRGLRPRLCDLFARAHSAGLTTSLDPGFDPAGQWGKADEWGHLLRQVDLFLPSRSEVCAITGEYGVDAAMTILANGMTRTVVKCGADGAVTLGSGGDLLREASRPLAETIDPTGAGDSFDAGFLHAWLSDKPLGECLRWGNACGALSTRGVGGTARQPVESEVREWLGAGT